MHPANVVRVTGDHARAVRRDDLAQRWYRHVGAMLPHQSGDVEPPVTVTAVAGHVPHGETVCDRQMVTQPSRNSIAIMVYQCVSKVTGGALAAMLCRSWDGCFAHSCFAYPSRSQC
jgi:hypothetical protein